MSDLHAAPSLYPGPLQFALLALKREWGWAAPETVPLTERSEARCPECGDPLGEHGF